MTDCPLPAVRRQLAAQYISPTSNTLVAYYRQLHPLPSAGPCIVPAQGPGIPVRPPGAFKTMRTITGRDGHALLLEYLEERPLFVMQRGMGARLTTYYRWGLCMAWVLGYECALP